MARCTFLGAAWPGMFHQVVDGLEGQYGLTALAP
jgi:hypothetical protein